MKIIKPRDWYDYLLLIIEILIAIIAGMGLFYTLPHATKDISIKIDTLNHYLADQQIQRRRLAGNEHVDKGFEALIAGDFKDAKKFFLQATEAYDPSGSAFHSVREIENLILSKEKDFVDPKTREKAKKELIKEIMSKSKYHQGFPESVIAVLKNSSERL